MAVACIFCPSQTESSTDVTTIPLAPIAAYLMGCTPPEMQSRRLDSRSRVFVFQHPELVAALREMQPEMRLLELIDSLGLLPDGQGPWEGTASAFERAMRDLDSTRMLDRIFLSGQAAGRMLAELARITPGRVVRTNHSGVSHYRILRGGVT